MTRPIYTLNQVTARIKEGDLSARVELSSGDELENLGDSFNQMTEALQISRHELIAAKDFVEKVIRTIPDPVVITNPDNKIMIVNQATLAMLGYKEEELIGHSVRKIFSREGTFDSSGFTRQGFIQNLNVDLVTKSGEKIPVSYSGASLFDENKNSISYIISAKDMRQVRELISKLEEAKDNLSRSFEELQNTQVKLVQAGKMSAVGQLAAGVAHEINNPLTGIMINSMLLKEQFEKSELQEIAQKEDIPECLNIIVESTQRCRSIVENLLSFSRQSKDESFISLDINEVIEKSLSLVDNQLRLSKIKLEIKLDRNLPRIAGNYNKLQQVVINLILNAHQFMPGGGTIDIASSLSRDESFVEVRVQDTGPGISRENMDKIFEPFFSTLQSSQSSRAGTGLGLSICYGIAKEHNGTIEVESSEGYGATFTVRLPVRSRKEQ
jgi:PAS domain S-box-containing protein